MFWVHAEALAATWRLYTLTGEQRYCPIIMIYGNGLGIISSIMNMAHGIG